MKDITSKSWVIRFIIGAFIILIICGGIVFAIDPYYHYRVPNNSLIYSVGVNQRNANNGIIKHFKYNAVITGTSMTDNFKASQFDDMYDVVSIKIPFEGASFKEINDNLETVFSINPDIEVVMRSLDLSSINCNADAMRYDEYPEYLYDNRIINDINYLLNKRALFEGCGANVIMSTVRKRPYFDFDNYSNWDKEYRYGKEVVFNTYGRPKKNSIIYELSSEDIARINENIEKNVIDLVAAHPNTRFIMFFPPYSICYWDGCNCGGTISETIQMQQIVIERLIGYENIELYSFFDDFELICNLDNYRDIAHYCGDVNSYILEQIKQGQHRITKDNYEEYIAKITDFYNNYDYDSLYD